MDEPLWPGGPRLGHAPGVFPLGVDSILLADFAGPGSRILDLGAGGGVLSILLAWERPDASVTALELSPAACELARHNFLQNGLEDRVTLLEADLRQARLSGFDLAVSNPPYFPENSGAVAGNGLETARSDGACTLTELCAAAGRAVRWGGAFALVFRPERLCDLLAALRAGGFEPKRLRPVHHAPDRPVNLLLVEARRGGRPGLRWEPDLYLHTAGGAESPEVRRIYRRP